MFGRRAHWCRSSRRVGNRLAALGVVLNVMTHARRPNVGAAAAIGIVLAVAGCSGGGGTASAPTTTKAAQTKTAAPATLQQRADEACRTSARGEFLNAQPTTVGKARSLIESSLVAAHPLAHAFRRAPTDGFAAYCWVSTGNEYTSYAVGPHGSVAVIANDSWANDLPPLPRPKPGPPPPGSEF